MFFGLPFDVNLKSQKFINWREFLIITGLRFLKKYLKKCSPLDNFPNQKKKSFFFNVCCIDFLNYLFYLNLAGENDPTQIPVMTPPPLEDLIMIYLFFKKH